MRMPLAAYRLDHGTRIELAAIPKMTALRRVWSVTRRWGERVSRAGRKLHGARPAIRKVEGAGTLGSSTAPAVGRCRSRSRSVCCCFAIVHDLLDPARPPDRSRFQCRQVGGGGRVDHSNGSKRRSTSVASSAAAALPPLRGYPRPALRALPSFRERLYAPREPLRVLSVPRSITATARQCATVLGARAAEWLQRPKSF